MAEKFEFIDCSTISLQLAANGLATLSMTVVSTEPIPGVNPPRDFTQQSFGGGEFKGFVTSIDTAPIPGSIPTVFEHRFSLVGSFCAGDCPRGTAN